jgi:DNA-binding transcriptional regulator GbsR (MarR family)
MDTELAIQQIAGLLMSRGPLRADEIARWLRMSETEVRAAVDADRSGRIVLGAPDAGRDRFAFGG